MKGEDPHAVDKTRAAIRDLHTQIKVSIHSVEAISKRIETLRDEELQPQLLELVQGYVSFAIFYLLTFMFAHTDNHSLYTGAIKENASFYHRKW